MCLEECSTPLMAFSQMTPYVRPRRISQNLNHLGKPLNPVRVWEVFYRRRLIVSTLTPQWLQAHGNRRVPSPVLLVATNRLGDLLAVVRSPLDLPEAEGGAVSVARGPPVVLISLNDNYCLNVHTAPNSVKEPNVGFVPSQDFVLSVQNVNFVSSNPRPPQKKGVSPPVNLTNVSIKGVNFVYSLSYSVPIPPAPVRTSAVSTAKIPTMWPPSYHKQGSNLSKGHILYLGYLRRKSRQVHKVSHLERPVFSSLVVTPVPFAPTADMFFKEASLLGNASFLLKHIGVSSVSQSTSVTNVRDAPAVLTSPPVGGRLQLFWQTWASMGASPWVVSILKNGYTVPFQTKPPLAREPLILSGYATSVRQNLLQESFRSLLAKQAIEQVHNPFSLWFTTASFWFQNQTTNGGPFWISVH